MSPGATQRGMLNVAKEFLYHLHNCVNTQIQMCCWASGICVWDAAGKDMVQGTQGTKVWFVDEEEKVRKLGRDFYKKQL